MSRAVSISQGTKFTWNQSIS